MMLCRTADQSSSDRSSSLPRYLNLSTPPICSAYSAPVRLNVAYKHLAVIDTSCLLHLIWVFLFQRVVLLCVMIYPAGTCITAILDMKWIYMKCLRNLTTLCATAGHPGTGYLNSCSTLGRDTTYVISSPPISLTLPHLGDTDTTIPCHVGLKIGCRHRYTARATAYPCLVPLPEGCPLPR